MSFLLNSPQFVDPALYILQIIKSILNHFAYFYREFTPAHTHF
jgi:hypothetical protein